MKLKSDVVWAVVLVGLASAAFLLGTKKSSLDAEAELQEKLKEIRLLESKNQQLSEELQSRGIYSYPQANVVPKMPNSVAMVFITLNGKDPIEDLRLKRKVIYNYSKVRDTVDQSLSAKTSDLGTLKQHNPSAFEVQLKGEEVYIQLEYNSRNKYWNQYIWLKKSTDGKYRSFWIITNQNAVIIDKHIDPGFPTTSEDNLIISQDKKIDYSELELNSIFDPRN